MASYTIGNPLLARPMLQRFAQAALHIPFRLNLQSLRDGNGCSISWDVPSTVICIEELDSETEAELKKYMQAIDSRIETLVRDVTANSA